MTQGRAFLKEKLNTRTLSLLKILCIANHFKPTFMVLLFKYLINIQVFLYKQTFFILLCCS